MIRRNLRKVGRQAAMDASEEAVRRALRGKVLENVRLVTRLQPWMREGLERRIRDFIRTGDIIDFDKAVLRKAITDSNVLTRSRLDLIANDQTNKFAAELNEIRMRAAGIMEISAGYTSQGDRQSPTATPDVSRSHIYTLGCPASGRFAWQERLFCCQMCGARE